MNVFVIISSIGISEPTPERIKIPHNTLIRGSLITSLKWAGLNWSPFLILTNLMCCTWTKIWLSSEKKHFFTLLRSNIYVFPNFSSSFLSKNLVYSGFVAFLPASSIRRRTVLELMWTPECIKFCKSKFVFYAWISKFRSQRQNSQKVAPKHGTICDVSCVQYGVLKRGPWPLYVISKKGPNILLML